jgi:hypothetical protein
VSLTDTNKDKRHSDQGDTVTNYYSGLQPEIYHVCRNCRVGNSIDSKNRREGRPRQAQLCEICAKLQRTGRGIPGMPAPTAL